MNNLLASFFSPSQTALIIAIAVVGVALIVLNIVLAYIFNKRGERKLHDLLLQQQRELLMQQLDEMRTRGNELDNKPANIKPFFMPADATPQTDVQVTEVAPVPKVEEVDELNEYIDESEEELATTDLSDDAVEEEETVIEGKVVRYNRSFAARLIQSSDELKARYSQLKNVMLAYEGVKDRRSWKKETYRRGRVTLAAFVIRGKSLCLCLAADPKRFENTKYKVIDLSVRSPKNKQPCLFRITSDRKTKYAEELIDMLFGENGAVKSERANIDYVMPFETTEQLISEQLIKIIDGVNSAPELPQSENDCAAEELAENIIEETAVTAEAVEEELLDRDFEILEEVDVSEAETISDEQAEQLVEVKVVNNRKIAGKKGIVNLDALSKNFTERTHVTIDVMKEKGLIARDVKTVKVLAKGSINKPLIVEADDFSLVAVKMIVLTGGRVIRRTTES